MSIVGTLANIGNALLPGHPFEGEVKNTGHFNNTGYPGISLQQAVSQTAPSGGGGGGAVASSDPYAKWGGAANYNSLVSGFNTQKDSVRNSAGDAASNYGIGYGNSILDFLDQQRLAQQKIDNEGVQADLAKRQGVRGVNDMVGRGIKSGGVMLANKNASNSSASGALARAYGDIGRRELSGVNNQFAQSQNQIQQEQDAYGVQRASGVRNIQGGKEQKINDIIAQAGAQLANLDAQIGNASLPNRINMEAEKQGVRARALAALQQYDQQLSSGIAGINPTGENDRLTKAVQLDQAGTAADNAYAFNDQAPTQFQGSGPFSAQLPLFRLNRRDQQAPLGA